jgi:2,4-dienoyl-CoA reductase-like NADH-dependent reductase (Old Yellow Enzyme family)
MCQYSARDGYANNWHYVHYGTRAVGGTGLIMLEATSVVPEGRITPYDLGIWNDNLIDNLQVITDLIQKQGAVAGIQLAHAGRKASHDSPDKGGKQLNSSEGGWTTFGPSSIAFDAGETPPQALDKSGIENVIKHFENAALRAFKAGFNLIEIHAAHGYLIHQFLSPLSNQRTDEYGGTFENRIRFLVEVVAAVQRVWPQDLPIFVRLSATDWKAGGWTPEETIQLSEILLNKGVDLIDCSSGGNVSDAKISIADGYQVPFSAAVKKTGIRTAAVGLITQLHQIEEILSNNQADLILLGRELLRNPYFGLQIENNPWPKQYLRAKK